jgi:hypothetical protein
MTDLLGSSLPIFVGITLVIMGFVSYMAGQALAGTWRPWWHAVPYGLMLGAVDRFFTWALFQGPLFGLYPYLIAAGIMLAICLGAYRLTLVRKMVSQYPWIYQRAGFFGWRAKDG